MRPLGLNMGERLGDTPEGIWALGMRSKACSRTKYWSTPYSKFKAMKERPYREMERSVSSRGMPLSSISSGMVTRRSISSGAWPGHWVMSSTCGGMAGPLGDELDVRGREIRIGVDGELLERPGTPHHHGEGRHQDQEGLFERKRNQSGDHGSALLDTGGELHKEAAIGQHVLAFLQSGGDGDHAR